MIVVSILAQFGTSFGVQKRIKRGIETMLTCNLPKANDDPPKKSAFSGFGGQDLQPRPPLEDDKSSSSPKERGTLVQRTCAEDDGKSANSLL